MSSLARKLRRSHALENAERQTASMAATTLVYAELYGDLPTELVLQVQDAMKNAKTGAAQRAALIATVAKYKTEKQL